MSWIDFTNKVTTATDNISKSSYYSDMSEIIAKINSIVSKLDTIENNATGDQTATEIVALINSEPVSININKINIPDASLSIAKTNGLQTALNGKADSSHTHIQTEITGLVDDLSNKSEIDHSHTSTDITDLQAKLNLKSDITHHHDHGECLLNSSGSDDDHPEYLSRITRGAPTNANVLETQISYKTGVTPVALNDVPRMIDILNVFSSGIAGSDSGTLDATGNVAVTHNIGTTSFFITGQIKTGSIWEQAKFDIDFTDDNNFVIKFGLGLNGKEYKYSFIATENLTGSTGIPTGIISGLKQGNIPANGSVMITHHLSADYISVTAKINVSDDLFNPTKDEWIEAELVEIDYDKDALGFTVHFGTNMVDIPYKINWLKRLI